MLRLLLCCLLFSAQAQDGTEELVREMQQAQEQLGGLLEQLQRVHNANSGGIQEAQRKVIALASDRHFLKAMGDLWNHESRSTVLLVDLAFFVLMVLLKAWRQAKARNWFTRLLTGFAFSLITWMGMLVLIPLVIFGEPYRVFFLTLWRTLFS